MIMIDQPQHVVILFFEKSLLLEDSPVRQSQVLGLANQLSKQKFNVTLIIEYQDHKSVLDVLDLRVSRDINVRLIKKKDFFSTFVTSLRILCSANFDGCRPLIYTRNIWTSIASLVACWMKGYQYIYDIRGDISAESKYKKDPFFKTISFSALHIISITRARIIMTVSSALTNKTKEWFLGKIIHTIPCLTNARAFTLQDREAVRQKLKFQESDVVFIYSGGVAPYQRLDLTIKMFNALSKQNESYKFLLLTHKQLSNTNQGFFPEILSPNIICLQVAQHQVHQYLCASDIAFVIRDNHPLNISASPVKCAEYLSAGLALVATRDVGGYSSFIEEHDAGLIIDQYDNVDSVVNEIVRLVHANN